jgi:hypothetical protein
MDIRRLKKLEDIILNAPTEDKFAYLKNMTKDQRTRKLSELIYKLNMHDSTIFQDSNDFVNKFSVMSKKEQNLILGFSECEDWEKCIAEKIRTDLQKKGVLQNG